MIYREGVFPAEVTPFAITEELIAPITTTINSGLSLLVPIGIGIMGSFIGISLIKRLVYTFL